MKKTTKKKETVDPSNSNRVIVKCSICGDRFSRYRAHPYLVKCLKCRCKGNAKQLSNKHRVTRKGSHVIDNVSVPMQAVQKLYNSALKGYVGMVTLQNFALNMVTYYHNRGALKGKRFFRIGSERFMTEKDLIAAFPYLLR